MKKIILLTCLLGGCTNNELVECRQELQKEKQLKAEAFKKKSLSVQEVENELDILEIKIENDLKRIEQSLKESCYRIKFYNNKLCGHDECNQPLPEGCR